jgi:DNA-binding response OmpR family regulator
MIACGGTLDLSQSYPKRILYVDDDFDSYELLCFYLSSLELVYARTLTDGLRLSQNEIFAVYLFDMQLTDGTGIELCKQIRLNDSRTPVLFLSADARDSTRQQALQAGAQDFLTKPINYANLMRLIHTLLIAD